MSSFSLADLKGTLGEMRASVFAKNETEKKVYDAISSKSWGASSVALNEIAVATLETEKFQIINEIIWAALETEGKSWKQIFKALTLVEFLIKNGSERFVGVARDELLKIKRLQDYNFYEGSVDKGSGCRERAKQIVELLASDETIRVEREKARSLRTRFDSVTLKYGGGSDTYSNANDYTTERSSDRSMGRYSGFSNDQKRDLKDYRVPDPFGYAPPPVPVNRSLGSKSMTETPAVDPFGPDDIPFPVDRLRKGSASAGDPDATARSELNPFAQYHLPPSYAGRGFGRKSVPQGPQAPATAAPSAFDPFAQYGPPTGFGSKPMHQAPATAAPSAFDPFAQYGPPTGFGSKPMPWAPAAPTPSGYGPLAQYGPPPGVAGDGPFGSKPMPQAPAAVAPSGYGPFAHYGPPPGVAGNGPFGSMPMPQAPAATTPSGYGPSAERSFGSSGYPAAPQNPQSSTYAPMSQQSPNLPAAVPSRTSWDILKASEIGDTHKLGELLKTVGKSDLRGVNPAGDTALMMAAHLGHLEVARMLLSAGADSNLSNQVSNRTVFLIFITYWQQVGHFEMVKILIDAGTDAAMRNKHGQSAADLAKTQDIRNFLSTHAPIATLLNECEQVIRQAALAPKRRDVTERLESLHAQYHAASSAAEDFQLIAALGMQLDAAQQESAALPLSEEDYQTLVPRHAQLLQRVEQKCRELMNAKAFPTLAALSAKLAAVKSLDLGISPEWANDPVFVPEDGANDPVLVTRNC